MPTTSRSAQTIAYFLAFIALGLVTGILGPTLPGLAEHARVQIGQVGILFTAQSAGNLLSALATGRLLDRTSGHPILAVQLLAMVAMLALTPFLAHLSLLTAVMFVIGAGMGTIDVGGNTLMVWIWRREAASRLSALHFFFGIGALLSPIIAAQVIGRTNDVDAAYWLLALLLLPLPFLFFRLPSPTARHDVSHLASSRPRLWPLFLLITLFFLYVGAEVSFGGWIYTYAVELRLADAATAGYLASIFWGALTLGRLLTIPISTRIRPRYILIGDLVGQIACLILLFRWPDLPIMVWAVSFGMGLFMASVFPAQLALAERNLPLSGQITSLFFVGASLGSMTLPWLIGKRIEATGPEVMTTLILAAVLAWGLVFAVFLLSLRAVSVQDTSAARSTQ